MDGALKPEAAPPIELRKSVSIFHLISISFFLVSAGPFGQEEAMAAGGALYTFLATLIVPFVFSLPLALMSSEQSTRLPACGGVVEWGLLMGRIPAVLNFFIHFLRNVSDNALYPVMVCDYLSAVIPKMDTSLWRFVTVFISNVIVILCNLYGLDAVGWMSFALSFAILSPFVLFFIFAARYMTPDRVFAKYPADAGSPDYGLLLTTVIWQFSGFDAVGALSAEVENPRRTFPIAMLCTVIRVTIVYLASTIAGLSVQPDVTQWHSGTFSTVAWSLPYCSSGWLAYWISMAGALAGLSLLNVALSCTGRELYAGGLLDGIPFAKYVAVIQPNCRGDPLPIRGIVIMSLLTLPLSMFGFQWLVKWSGLLGVITQVIQGILFILLRVPNWVERIRAKQRASKEEGENHPSYVQAQEPIITVEANLTDKFIIAGGWPVAILCASGLFASSIIVCVASGWEQLVGAVLGVAAMCLIKGVDIAIKKMIASCRKDTNKLRSVQPVQEDAQETAPLIILE
jgi:amino acid transporter